MRILVIEDDERIRSFTSKGLRQAGHVVDDTAFGQDGLAFWEHSSYDAVILDLSLPELDGMTILKTMRQKGNTTPVIIVSARKAVDERVEGLESGADDYLIKPFSFSELLARLYVINRRWSSPSPADVALAASYITLNTATRTVSRQGKSISLKPKEFALLEFMVRNPNRVLTKELILRQVWDYRFDPQSNIVDALISRLRSKIDAPFDSNLIETRRGIGYVFVCPA